MEKIHNRPQRAIHWEKIPVATTQHELFPSVLKSFHQLALRTQKVAELENIQLSQRALCNLIFSLVEVTIDMTLACDLDPVVIDVTEQLHKSIDVTKQLYKSIGTSSIDADGRPIVLLGSDWLIAAAQAWEAILQKTVFEGTDFDLLIPILQVVAGLAHELGHVHQLKNYVGNLADLMKDTQELEELKAENLTLVSYQIDLIETNAEAKSLRYLREKQRVGGERWQAFPIEGITAWHLARIMSARNLANVSTQDIEMLVERMRARISQLQGVDRQAVPPPGIEPGFRV